MKNNEIKYTIEQQGAPVISSVYTTIIHDNIIALEIDMKSKYCEIGGHVSTSEGYCGIMIDAIKSSLYLDESKDKDMFTSIMFTEYKGWSIYCADVGRYTIRVVLVKDEN